MAGERRVSRPVLLAGYEYDAGDFLLVFLFFLLVLGRPRQAGKEREERKGKERT